MTEVDTTVNVQYPRFVNRIYTYPVVSSACGQVANAYSKVKNANKIVNAGLSLTENGLKMVATTATPLVVKLEDKVHLDELACSQLDKLETTLPIITKPVDEITKQAKSMMLKKVEPTIVAADKMCHNVKKTINNVEAFGKEQLTAVTESSYGQRAMSKMVYALDLADEYIDYYLPADKVTGSDENKKKAEMEEETKPTTAATRVMYITSKMRRRMFQKAMKKLDCVKVRSNEAMEKMNFTVDLIAYAKNHIDGIAESANELKQDFNYKLWELEAAEKNLDEYAEHEDDKEMKTPTTPCKNKLALKTAKMTQSLVYWSHKLNLSLQAAKYVVAGRVHVPQNVSKTITLAADCARKLYQDITKFNLDDLKSLSLIKENLVTIDTYLKSFFNLIDNNPIVQKMFGKKKSFESHSDEDELPEICNFDEVDNTVCHEDDDKPIQTAQQHDDNETAQQHDDNETAQQHDDNEVTTTDEEDNCDMPDEEN